MRGRHIWQKIRVEHSLSSVNNLFNLIDGQGWHLIGWHSTFYYFKRIKKILKCDNTIDSYLNQNLHRTERWWIKRMDEIEFSMTQLYLTPVRSRKDSFVFFKKAVLWQDSEVLSLQSKILLYSHNNYQLIFNLLRYKWLDFKSYQTYFSLLHN